jgi:hypothetical protein
MIRGQTPTDQRNILVFTLWCLAWAISFVGVTFAIKAGSDSLGPFAWPLAMVPLVIGVGTVRALLRFLREADEFTRKIQLEGICIGFGAGHLFCIGYFFLEQFGAPRISMVFAILPLAFGWAAGSLIVAARYR